MLCDGHARVFQGERYGGRVISGAHVSRDNEYFWNELERFISFWPLVRPGPSQRNPCGEVYLREDPGRLATAGGETDKCLYPECGRPFYWRLWSNVGLCFAHTLQYLNKDAGWGFCLEAGCYTVTHAPALHCSAHRDVRDATNEPGLVSARVRRIANASNFELMYGSRGAVGLRAAYGVPDSIATIRREPPIEVLQPIVEKAVREAGARELAVGRPFDHRTVASIEAGLRQAFPAEWVPSGHMIDATDLGENKFRLVVTLANTQKKIELTVTASPILPALFRTLGKLPESQALFASSLVALQQTFAREVPSQEIQQQVEQLLRLRYMLEMTSAKWLLRVLGPQVEGLGCEVTTHGLPPEVAGLIPAIQDALYGAPLPTGTNTLSRVSQGLDGADTPQGRPMVHKCLQGDCGQASVPGSIFCDSHKP